MFPSKDHGYWLLLPTLATLPYLQCSLFFFATTVSATTYPTSQILLSTLRLPFPYGCFFSPLFVSFGSFSHFQLHIPSAYLIFQFPQGIFQFWKLVLTLLAEAAMLGSLTSYKPRRRCKKFKELGTDKPYISSHSNCKEKLIPDLPCLPTTALFLF